MIESLESFFRPLCWLCVATVALGYALDHGYWLNVFWIAGYGILRVINHVQKNLVIRWNPK